MKTELGNSLELKTDSNTALLIARELIEWRLSIDQDLHIFADLSYILHSIDIKGTKPKLIEEFSALIEKSPEHLTACLNLVNSASNEKKRKFLYLTVLSLTHWSSKDREFVKQLSETAGTDTPGPDTFKQLLETQISCFILSQQIQNILQVDNSDSYIRLLSTV